MWLKYGMYILFLCAAVFVRANELSLAAQLTHLSQLYAIPIIYKPSLLQGLSSSEELKATASLQQALDQLLLPHSLSWRKIDAGILVYTPPPQQAMNLPADIIEEVMVIGQQPSEQFNVSYKQSYQQAAKVAQQLKSNYVGEAEFAMGAMLTQSPAENIAETLQAVPGLSITRDRGEALNISSMGLGAQYQSTLLNGHRLANTENVRNSNQYGQQYRFDTFSADLFSNIAVYKLADARLPSGAIGATVNLMSEAPLAFDDNNFKVTLTSATLAGDQNFQPSVGFMGNVLSEQGDLAGVFKFNYENRLQRQFQFETWHWGENGLAPADFHWSNIADDSLVPTDGMALTIEHEDRTRATYYGNLAWQADSNLALNLLWFQSETDFAFDEHRLSVKPQSHSATATYMQTVNSLQQFKFNNAVAKTTREESKLFYTNQTLQFEMPWQVNKHWKINPFYSHSEAISRTQEPITRVHTALAPSTIDVAINGLSVDYFDVKNKLGLVSSYSHISNMSKRTIKVLNQVEEWGVDSYLQLDTQWGLNALEVGFLSSQQQHDYTRRDVSLSAQSLADLPQLDGRWLEPISINFEADFIENAVQRWLLPKSDLFQLYDINLPFAQATQNDLLNSYQVQFNGYEGYLLSHWQWPSNDRFEWSAGMRWAELQTRTRGYTLKDKVTPSLLHTDNHYTAWLPSFNLKWQQARHWQWRLSYSRALNRPNYSDLNPKLHINSGGLPYAEMGNPNLQPVIADTTSVSVSWQESQQSAQFLAFHHDLDNFIFEQTDLLTFDDKQYTVLQRTNQGNAQITGLQLSYDWQLPISYYWLAQSRVVTSYTQLLNAQLAVDTKQTFAVQGVSDRTANLRLLLGDEQWHSAININYRSDFLEHRDLSNNADTYVSAFTGIDLSFSWLFSDAVSLRFDIFNATDQGLFRTAQTDNAHSLMKAEEFGRRFVLSLSLAL